MPATHLHLNPPRISIVMPAFNAGLTIAESIKSVQKQKFREWQLIVVDDGSRDNTSEIVKNFQKEDDRIDLLLLRKNVGLPNARNEGCRAALGEFIAFLDSDDLWHEDKLNVQMAFHQRNEDVEISHTDYYFFVENKILKRPWKHLVDRKKDKSGILYPKICYQNSVGVLTVVVRKDLLEKVGYFDTSMWTLEDQDLWIRIARENKKFGYIDKALAYYRLSSGGITTKTGKYKLAYKRFIHKLNGSGDVDINLLWRSYYRYFGTLYFQKQNFFLAQLYFRKSIQLVPYDYLSFTSRLYFLYAIVKAKFRVMLFNTINQILAL